MATSLAPTEPAALRLSEILSALSYALDITEGQPEGHAVRTCLIGMGIADVAGIAAAERGPLFYALLLKDLGCSSNAARLCNLFGTDDLALKRSHKVTDWTRSLPSLRYALSHAAGSSPVTRFVRTVSIGVRERGSGREMTQTRCDRGADIAAMLGFTETTRDAIRSLDEHWDGQGMPLGLAGDRIPLLGRVVGLAQTTEVFASKYGVEGALEVMRERRGSWFDPDLVDALLSLRGDTAFWSRVLSEDPRAYLGALEPEEEILVADDERLDDIAAAFARVIDAKSPYTYRHSEGVAEIAVGIGAMRGFPEGDLRTLRRAGLLHDIGKLGVSNLILDKPGRLTVDEMAQVRRHPAYTHQILRRVAAFGDIVEIASSHHERLDGKGYHRGLGWAQLCPLSRALVVADISEALRADRPYRSGLPWEQVRDILRRERGTAVCEASVAALDAMLEEGYPEIERITLSAAS